MAEFVAGRDQFVDLLLVLDEDIRCLDAIQGDGELVRNGRCEEVQGDTPNRL